MFEVFTKESGLVWLHASKRAELATLEEALKSAETLLGTNPFSKRSAPLTQGKNRVGTTGYVNAEGGISAGQDVYIIVP